ncbi:cysteine proteinase [Rozella allomycis CSF55]|uniref:ubiquitinyl hydrolase 1 n=1 Tax=Rozella allomycis (strain CSF55) TaxID=988480 RepID=A0A075B4L0_ROZAC|nr:Peptidase C19, ubiquitin carboxyl-terminal hydrolase 2 domain-containing protein [Rozella allomycis CSF55]RKP22080.1 cysteine proteinase [Rozella allomycis CSF55]|eukprot:EPZ36437.1 Peptidase C19, ubiquitin carboxyl-terminal hydrolase 2 domain-containing protein [Rozella allomycis CSF55]
MMTLDENFEALKCSGLRGLYNLGQTCFMNCVLQACFNNPILKNFFLEESHVASDKCGNKESDSSICITCELDMLFEAYYSGDIAPISTHRFLYSIWLTSKELVGYDQQDAHEFFICMVDGVHKNHCKELGHNENSENCSCVMHKSFAGTLCSTVTCFECGATTNSFESFIDISLSLNVKNSNNGQSFNELGLSRIHCLSDCLARFTAEERLGNTYACNKCSQNNCSRKLSFHKFPPVLCLHLKRFEHTALSTTKIDTFVSYPTEMNVSKYSSTSEIANDHKYELFAVIHHVGTVDNGHYTAYLKFMKQWFRMDDHMVTKVDIREVTRLTAYMLYYKVV